ncbi:MAG TPA: hypothetical protein P5164_02255 [Thermoanaerobaculia bacterium]|nr:hypothetical protein [Thermoanaerobaculia bacterium]
MVRLCARLAFALLVAAPLAAAVGRPASPTTAPSEAAAPGGQAFALALGGSGSVLASGPYALRVPGAEGPLRLELARLAVDGARLRGEARLTNGSGSLLSGLELDFRTVTTTVRAVPGRAAPEPAPLSLSRPLSLGELLPGEATPFVPFEVAPLPLGEDVTVVVLLGAVTGLAASPPISVEGALRPVALDVDRSGRLYVATSGVGRVLRLTAASAASPGEAARPSAPPTGVALRRRDQALFVATGGPTVEVHRPGRARPATLDAGRPVTLLRVDASGVLRAASGNGVLAFDEAKAGPPAPLGPEGSAVLSFDADARGRVHAVVRNGETRQVVVAGTAGASPLAAGRGPGADALLSPRALRFAADGTTWVAAEATAPEGAALTRFSTDGTPLGTLPRLGLALLLGKDEDAAVPAIVDLAPGPDGLLWVLLESGALFGVRPL